MGHPWSKDGTPTYQVDQIAGHPPNGISKEPPRKESPLISSRLPSLEIADTLKPTQPTGSLRLKEITPRRVLGAAQGVPPSLTHAAGCWLLSLPPCSTSPIAQHLGPLAQEDLVHRLQ